jgi:hypothetical protein
VRPPADDNGPVSESDLPPAPGRNETPEEHADRNFLEIVQELRVAQTGVQILFAFLLSLPFLADFPQTPSFTRVHTGALLSSALATVCFIAPVASHRSLFRKGRKEEIVRLAHQMSVIGLVLLALSMGLASWLVLAVLWSDSAAWAMVAGLFLVVAVAWVLVPKVVARRAEARSRSARTREPKRA